MSTTLTIDSVSYKTDMVLRIHPDQYNLILTGRRTRHTYPIDPQPTVSGITKYWNDKYYSMSVLEMFALIMDELKVKPGNVVTFVDEENPDRQVLCQILTARIDKFKLIENREALEEGVENLGGNFWRDYMLPPNDPETKKPMRNSFVDAPIKSFHSLFTAVHGPDMWNLNPYIITFTFNPVMYATKEN